jgi:glycosyltransferase involved in cell wall biosynthesis
MRWLQRLLPVGVLATSLAPAVEMLWRGKPTPLLSRIAPVDAVRSSPRVSVIVAVRNEEAAVRDALRSLLAQDYPQLELIVANDRSTDATGQVLAEVSADPRLHMVTHEAPRPGSAPGELADTPRLRIVTVEALPPGWLGKPHALWLGAQQATGEWLLFTDADVVFAPDCVRLAVGYVSAARLDHLTLGSTNRARSFLLGAFVAYFRYLLVIFFRLYRVNDPVASEGIGLGAFNLVRGSAYDAVGTYAAVARRPDDDIRFGQLVRRKGFRQQLLDGSDLLEVEWYPSLTAAFAGLEKNFFASYSYNLPLALLSNALLLVAYVWPWPGALLTRGPGRWLLFASVLTQVATFFHTRGGLVRLRPIDVGYALAMPLSAVLVSYTALRSTVVTLVRGGIRWRGTFYPLSELRRP